MKTKEELNVLKEEVETLSKKLAELNEEELEQVTGGIAAPDDSTRIRELTVIIVERITATMEALKAHQIVNIVFRNEELCNTEANISMVSGQIYIEFVSADTESVSLLNQYCGELRSLLMERLPSVDYIEVVVHLLG